MALCGKAFAQCLLRTLALLNKTCRPQTDPLSCHTHHQLLQCPFSVVFMDQQHFLDDILLEAHLIELIQQMKELLSLNRKTLFDIVSNLWIIVSDSEWFVL